MILTAKPKGWKTIIEAFTAKYGKPCRTSVDEIQDQRHSTVETWCFSTGQLMVMEIMPGSSPEVTGGFYVDKDTKADPPAAAPKPKINF
jgi:hypothetical protein